MAKKIYFFEPIRIDWGPARCGDWEKKQAATIKLRHDPLQTWDELWGCRNGSGKHLKLFSDGRKCGRASYSPNTLN
jgi:hypothetical protein